MKNLVGKNSIYISFSNNIENNWNFFNDAIPIYDIETDNKNNNVVVAINKDFYTKHKLYCTSIITNAIKQKQFNSVILNSFSFIKNISLQNNISFKNLYFTKNCDFDCSAFLNLSCKNNFKNLIFENNISIDDADLLSKKNITFSTIQNYKLFNLNKISGNNDLFSFSDYYYLNKLNITQDLDEKELQQLNQFFGFNKNLFQINLSCSIKNALKIVELYTKNNSKYSCATFNLSLPNILINSPDRENLYNINKNLKNVKSKLNLIVGKENLTYLSYIKTINPLKKYANKINSLNLSPLEKLVLIEDYVKTKPYLDSKNKNISRNFFSSLNSDYIVCFIYSYTFKTLCDLCNINCCISTCKLNLSNNKSSEHSKIICKVNDEKYNYNGILLFDPTFDAVDNKTIFDEEKPTDNFLFFANTLHQSKFYLKFSQTDFGLLKIADDSNALKEKVQNIEACNQINELYKTNILPYTTNGKICEEYKIALNKTLSILKNSNPIQIDTFFEILKFARQNFDCVNDEDIKRIKTINSYKAVSQISDKSDNMFLDKSMLEIDNNEEPLLIFDEI